jgi:hypothetical protein
MAALHTVPVATNPSTGHAAPIPVQLSAMSQSSTAALHTVPVATNPSAGHAALIPVQLSASSHAPAAARHVVPAAANTSTGHAAFMPSHNSGASHTPADVRHTVVVGARIHVPTEPGALHIWQSPADPHAELQQTPSAQKPLWQSAAKAQPSPSVPMPKSSTVLVYVVGVGCPPMTIALPFNNNTAR